MPDWEIVPGPRLSARLPDGRLVDLQAQHVAARGFPSPHLRDVASLRLAASYGQDLVAELVGAAILPKANASSRGTA